jgi:hypothetical protein
MNSLILEVLKIILKDIKEIIKAKNKKEIKNKLKAKRKKYIKIVVVLLIGYVVLEVIFK